MRRRWDIEQHMHPSLQLSLNRLERRLRPRLNVRTRRHALLLLLLLLLLPPTPQPSTPQLLPGPVLPLLSSPYLLCPAISNEVLSARQQSPGCTHLGCRTRSSSKTWETNPPRPESRSRQGSFYGAGGVWLVWRVPRRLVGSRLDDTWVFPNMGSHSFCPQSPQSCSIITGASKKGSTISGKPTSAINGAWGDIKRTRWPSSFP